MSDFYEDVQNYMNGKLTEDEFVQTVETSALNGDYGEIDVNQIWSYGEVKEAARLGCSLDDKDVQKLIKGFDRLLYTDSLSEASKLLEGDFRVDEKIFPYYCRSRLLDGKYRKFTPSALLAGATLCHMSVDLPKREVEHDPVFPQKEFLFERYTNSVLEFYKSHINKNNYEYSLYDITDALSREMESFTSKWDSVILRMKRAKKCLSEHQKIMAEKKGEKIDSSAKPTTQNSYSAGLSKTNSHGGR